MCRAPRAGTLASMPVRAVVIHLEVRLDGDSPIGCAYDDDRRQRDFAGWIGLVAAVEELLTGPASGSAGGRPVPNHTR